MEKRTKERKERKEKRMSTSSSSSKNVANVSESLLRLSRHPTSNLVVIIIVMDMVFNLTSNLVIIIIMDMVFMVMAMIMVMYIPMIMNMFDILTISPPVFSPSWPEM